MVTESVDLIMRVENCRLLLETSENSKPLDNKAIETVCTTFLELGTISDARMLRRIGIRLADQRLLAASNRLLERLDMPEDALAPCTPHVHAEDTGSPEEWFRKNLAALAERYPGVSVAVSPHGVVAWSMDEDRVRQQVKLYQAGSLRLRCFIGNPSDVLSGAESAER